jgi:hypothetical protein
VILAVEIAETLAEHASLWAIRAAMVAMFAVFAMQIRGMSEVSVVVRSVWLMGALAALMHSVGALWAFHQGSHEAAFESTAKQTEELLGIAVGIGLYVNYLFVLVWFVDACLRFFRAEWYKCLPNWYQMAVYGFLVFIAINGVIVFKAGVVRWIGISAIAILCMLWFVKLRGKQLSRLTISHWP